MNGVGDKIKARQVARHADETRYKTGIIPAFATGSEEPSDTDEILQRLGISLDQFSSDIELYRHRSRLAASVEATLAASKRADEVSVKIDKAKREFDAAEARYKEERKAMLRERDDHFGTIAAGQQAKKDLVSSADPKFHEEERRLTEELRTAEQNRHLAETVLRRQKAILPRGQREPLGGASSNGPNFSLMERCEAEIAASEKAERRLAEAIRAVRNQMLVP